MTMHIDTTRLGTEPVALDEPIPGSRVLSARFRHVQEFVDNYGVGRHRSFAAVFFGRSPLPRGSKTQFRAAAGELAVADALWQLGQAWSIFDAAPVSQEGTSVDHIAIGPAGTFIISVRNHVNDELWVSENVMLVDGERVPHIRDSESAAVRATQLLSDAIGERVEVTPCVVVIDPRSLTVSRPPRRVAVMTLRELKPWLKNLPQTLSDDQRDRLCAAASAETTWPERPDRQNQPQLAVGEFRKLQADVNQSRRIRMAWVTGILIVGWLVALAGAIGISVQRVLG